MSADLEMVSAITLPRLIPGIIFRRAHYIDTSFILICAKYLAPSNQVRIEFRPLFGEVRPTQPDETVTLTAGGTTAVLTVDAAQQFEMWRGGEKSLFWTVDFYRDVADKRGLYKALSHVSQGEVRRFLRSVCRINPNLLKDTARKNVLVAAAMHFYQGKINPKLVIDAVDFLYEGGA